MQGTSVRHHTANGQQEARLVAHPCLQIANRSVSMSCEGNQEHHGGKFQEVSILHLRFDIPRIPLKSIHKGSSLEHPKFVPFNLQQTLQVQPVETEDGKV